MLHEIAALQRLNLSLNHGQGYLFKSRSFQLVGDTEELS